MFVVAKQLKEAEGSQTWEILPVVSHFVLHTFEQNESLEAELGRMA